MAAASNIQQLILGDEKKWTTFQALHDFSKITSLCLSHQHLHAIPCMLKMYHLKDLDLSHNELAVLAPNRLPSSISKLDLSWNNICEVGKSFKNQFTKTVSSSLANKPHLTDLNLSHNKISKLVDNVFLNSSKIKNLDLSFNFLTRHFSPLAGLHCLEELDFSHNQISSHNELSCLSACLNLRSLDLAENPIVAIGYHANLIMKLLPSKSLTISKSCSNLKTLVLLILKCRNKRTRMVKKLAMAKRRQ